MSPTFIPIWKKAPFMRLLVPLIAGILLQWSVQFQWVQIMLSGICFSIALLLFRLLPIAMRFKLQALQGLLINLVVLVTGSLLTFQKDIRHRPEWFGHHYSDDNFVVMTLQEPPVERDKSFKADASVEMVGNGSTVIPAIGNVILYFAKDSGTKPLQYGDRVIVDKRLQPIKNSGNPGTFDYKKYCAFRKIFHTAFLKKGEWALLPGRQVNDFDEFLFTSRQNILNVLHQNMTANDDQLSIAEALLIGYTQDLDRDLVQAYSNTGVVHIIAISGMHLGLIYVMLAWLFNRIPCIKRIAVLRAVLVLSGLWLFALLTGGGASILRSATMFSCIVIGELFQKKTSIYNSLAASAFILLCVNPFYLWDVGFQLSYLALYGIVIFQKPVYRLFYIRNKPLDEVWKLTAVSLAAQIFTFPVCLYYFHQFPALFLFTNLLTVPLSTVILFVEIFLVAFAWISPVASFIGKITWWLVWLMNKIILFFNGMPYALWERIPATVTSTTLLYLFVCSIGFWLLNKSGNAFRLSLLSLLAFCFLNAYTIWGVFHQQKIVVYNIPQHQAIDLVSSNGFTFIGDSASASDGRLHNLNIKPGRILFQLNQPDKVSAAPARQRNFFYFLNRKILILDSTVTYELPQQKIDMDVIIISKNAGIHMEQLAGVFNCRKYVFDASNSLWKIEQWKRDCGKLHLPFYSVPDKGAFIMEL